MDGLFIVTLIILIILLFICLLAKLFKVAIGLGIMVIVIPILFTLFWGDGSGYIASVAKFLPDSYQEQLEESYEFYKDQEAAAPIIDYDQVAESTTDVFASAIEKSGDAIVDAITPDETG